MSIQSSSSTPSTQSKPTDALQNEHPTVTELKQMINPQCLLGKQRLQYPREFKLRAISYLHEQLAAGLSKNAIATQLRISAKMLTNWVEYESEILLMKNGQQKRSSTHTVAYPEMEDFVYEEYLKLQVRGIKMNQAWFIDKGKEWYERHFPALVHTDPITNIKTSRGFKFSRTWLRRFKRRKNIAVRKRKARKVSGNNGNNGTEGTEGTGVL